MFAVEILFKYEDILKPFLSKFVSEKGGEMERRTECWLWSDLQEIKAADAGKRDFLGRRFSHGQ